jgi:hypothetical protein
MLSVDVSKLYCHMSNFSAMSCIERTIYSTWDDYDIRFVLDQHTELDFYYASSLKQQPTDRHVAPLRSNILVEKQQILILWSLVWPNQDSNTRSTTLESNMQQLHHRCSENLIRQLYYQCIYFYIYTQTFFKLCVLLISSLHI